MPKADLGIVLGIVSSCLVAAAAAGQETTSHPTAQPTSRRGQSDPAVQRVAGLIEEAKKHHPQKQPALARRAVRKAHDAALKLVDAGSRPEGEQLFWKLGRVASTAGDLRTAEDCFQRVLACRLRTLSDDHADLQKARLNLGNTKRALGDLKGAMALQQKALAVWSRTLPDDHPHLQIARLSLGNTKYTLGDLKGAMALQQKVLGVFSRTLPDDHPNLQIARGNLAATKHSLGDLKGALALQQKVLDVLSRTLPDDHLDLQSARGSLADTRRRLGDLRGALALHQKVFEIRSRRLPDDHPDLQKARLSLAVTKRRLGDLEGALPLVQKAFDVFSRTLPDDHPDLQSARGSLAATKHALGDLQAALALCQKVLDVESRTLPDDHRDLQIARGNLAASKSSLGDLKGALALHQKVHDVLIKTFPDDHPDLQRARGNLAVIKYRLRDLKGVLALEQKVCEVYSRTLPDDHPDLQRARENLAMTKRTLGDSRGALALQQRVLEVLSRTLPDEHPDLQRARGNLAMTKHTLGDLQGAQALFRKVFDVQSRTLPDDHPYLQKTRLHLLRVCYALDHNTGSLPRDGLRSCRRALARWGLSPRAQGSLATCWLSALDVGLTLASVDPHSQPGLAADALLAAESIRGLEVRHGRHSRLVAAAGRPDQVRGLQTRIRDASHDLTRVLRRKVPLDAPDAKRRLEALRDEQRKALREKEGAEQELAVLAKSMLQVDHGDLTAADLAGQLPEGAAAVSVIRYRHDIRTSAKGPMDREPRFAALRLDRGGSVDLVPLGRAEPIEKTVSAIRALKGEVTTKEQQLLAHLSKQVMTPILNAVGKATTLYVAVDESLALVPLDALPGRDGEPIGKTVTIVPVVSLLELVEPRPSQTRDGDGNTLLVVGAVSYDATPKEDGKQAKHSGRGSTMAAPVLSAPTRGGSARYRSLPWTALEVRELRSLFRKHSRTGTVTVLSTDRAGKQQLQRAVRGARFVHIATHGYFAPAAATSTLEVAGDRLTELLGQVKQQARGLSPLVLTGLALSGANLPPDELGQTDGIITAEEILALDLTACELVTLSACNTSLGIRRAGQGYASLRAALQGAGARYVVTSLWEVGDENTRILMSDFYRRMWQKKKPPRKALWEAKMQARKAGMQFRDWAAWVLTGL